MGPWLSKIFREGRENDQLNNQLIFLKLTRSNFLQINLIHVVCISINFRGAVVSVKLKGWIFLQK